MTAAVATIGHNQPPTAYEACVAHMDDLLTEARNWADGQKVETQEQADAVDRLIEDLRLAAKAADDARVAEKKPLDDLIQEIQDRFNIYLAPLANKKPGKVPVAMDALKATVTPWKNKLEADRRAQAEEARRIAAEAAQKAADAMRAAQASDIGAREEAEALVDAAIARLDLAGFGIDGFRRGAFRRQLADQPLGLACLLAINLAGHAGGGGREGGEGRQGFRPPLLLDRDRKRPPRRLAPLPQHRS